MNTGITIKDIRDQYIIKALSGLKYNFKVFIDTGAYIRSIQRKNLKKSTINACLQLTDGDVVALGGGLQAVAVDVTLSFLLPVPDEAFNGEGEFNGSYMFVDEFREALVSVFATQGKLALKNETTGKTYVGAVSAGFPVGSELSQRQLIGQSFEYVCYFQFSYLESAINASNVAFYLDDSSVPISYTQFTIQRESSLSGNTMSDNVNEESKTYAENSVFSVTLSLPALDREGADATIYSYLMGEEKANTPHTLKICYPDKAAKEITVIFGRTVDSGENVLNVSREIVFVPYVDAEDEA